jgi:imidazolonepropionase
MFDAALVWNEGGIVWVGPDSELPLEFKQCSPIDASNQIVIPGLIDCHTHLAFAGWRADEFVERIQGATYLEIAARGGGIASTVAKTRAASFDALFERARLFLHDMGRAGVTTIEAKSGYGLNLETEIKLLEVYQRLGATQPISIVPTFLGAHTIPTEFKTNRAGYIELLCKEMLPAVAKRNLAKFCDIFVEQGAFSAEEARDILQQAASLGFKLKIHADQLSDGGGAALAASVRAISADHLEHVNDTGLVAMAKAEVVAVLLPIATLYTKENFIPLRRFDQAGVITAIASDFNPGTSPSFCLQLALLLACTQHGFTPEQALRAVTINAARALCLEEEIGSLETGKKADFVLVEADSVSEWIYHFNPSRRMQTFKKGKLI